MEPSLNTSPIASGSQMPPAQPPRHGAGPAAGVVIVIVLLIIGGLYFWGAKLSNENNSNPPPFILGDEGVQESPAAVAPTNTQTTGLPTQNASDDAASIQADFEQTDFNSLNSQTAAELDNI